MGVEVLIGLAVGRLLCTKFGKIQLKMELLVGVGKSVDVGIEMVVGTFWVEGSVFVGTPAARVGEDVLNPNVGTRGSGVGWPGKNDLIMIAAPPHNAKIPTIPPVIHHKLVERPIRFAIFLAIMNYCIIRLRGMSL